MAHDDAPHDTQIETHLQQAAEVLSGDERLRAHLSDAEFAALLDWALAQTAQHARAHSGDEAALQQHLDELRAFLSGFDAAVGSRDTLTHAMFARRLRNALNHAAAITGITRATIDVLVRSLAHDRDQDSAVLVGRLLAALPGGSGRAAIPQTSPRDNEPAAPVEQQPAMFVYPPPQGGEQHG